MKVLNRPPQLPSYKLGGTRLGFAQVSIIEGGYVHSIIDTYAIPSLVPPKGIQFPANLGLVLT